MGLKMACTKIENGKVVDYTWDPQTGEKVFNLKIASEMQEYMDRIKPEHLKKESDTDQPRGLT